jgi:hypothetical protein
MVYRCAASSRIDLGCMAELEIRNETEIRDSSGKLIGILASLIGVLLALVTILSHRSHTAAVLLKAEASDKWSFYQSKRIKFHSLELGTDLLGALQVRGPEAEIVILRYTAEKVRYQKEGEEAQADARKTDLESAHVESRALRFDFGEGLLEVGLILTSLYFISKSTVFPVVGMTCAIAGIATAASGYLL